MLVRLRTKFYYLPQTNMHAHIFRPFGRIQLAELQPHPLGVGRLYPSFAPIPEEVLKTLVPECFNHV